MPSNFLLFDRVRALAQRHRVFQAERTYQDQSQLDRMAAGGQFYDPGQSQNLLLNQTNLQLARLDRYKDYEQMDQMGEISLALDLYADESSTLDSERKHTVIIRANSRRLKRELEEFLFDTLLWDNYCRPAVRYLCKFGCFPAEIVPDRHRSGVSSLRFMNTYNFTRVETAYGDLVGFFHQDELKQQPLFLHPWQVMHLRLTSFENVFHPYGKCSHAHTFISTPTGPVYIKDVQVGDLVYAFNGQEQVTSRVLAKACNGVKPIISIRTKHHELRVTAEHPVYVSGHGYKPAAEIVLGDRLVIPKPRVAAETIKLPPLPNLYARLTLYGVAQLRGCRPGCTTLSKQFGRTATQIRKFLTGRGALPYDLAIRLLERLSPGSDHAGYLEKCLKGTGILPDLPKTVSPDFARLFGFLVGDGWTTRNQVCFAVGQDESVNHYYESLLRRYGAGVSRTVRKETNNRSVKDCAAVTCSWALAETLRLLGLNNGASNKTVPGWVYRLDDRAQHAFLQGLIDSDGNSHTGEWSCERHSVESISRELLHGIKALLHQMGYKCGNIGRHKPERVQIFDGKECRGRPSYVLYFWLSKLDRSGDAITEPVNRIARDGDHEVWDLQVDHEASNFVADGVVVHNSVLDGGRKKFKQLRLMEDAALIYRLTRAPEKRKFTIPVGLIPPKEVPEYMAMIARTFKRHRFYNVATGQFDESYSPLIQEDDFFLPRRPDGTGPDIETLPGAENLDQIKDIEYFKKGMIAPLKIPFSRVGIGEGAGEGGNKPLSQESADFAKAVQWIQRELVTGLTKVCIVHLALRGYRVEDIKGFELAMSATNAMEELYRMETWQTRVGVMAELKELGWFPKEWIITHFTDLTPDEIQELKEIEAIEAMGGEDNGRQGGGGGGGHPPGGGGLGDLPPLGDGDGGGGDDLENEQEPGPGGPTGLDLGEGPDSAGEAWDRAAQLKVLTEIRLLKKRATGEEIRRYLVRLAGRLGKDQFGDDRRPANGFGGLLEAKEFDALTTTPVGGGVAGDRGLLVEWSVPRGEREAAIAEVRAVLAPGPETDREADGEVLQEDLPAATNKVPAL